MEKGLSAAVSGTTKKGFAVCLPKGLAAAANQASQEAALHKSYGPTTAERRWLSTRGGLGP